MVGILGTNQVAIVQEMDLTTQREVVIYNIDTKAQLYQYTHASMTATNTIKLTRNKHVNFREGNTIVTFLFRLNTVEKSQSWIMSSNAIWVNANATDYIAGGYSAGSS